MTTSATPMTTDADGNAVETKTFIVSYRIVTAHNVTVERPVNISQEDLLLSIDKDDLVEGDGEITWDDVKGAWRDNDVHGIYNEDFEEVF